MASRKQIEKAMTKIVADRINKDIEDSLLSETTTTTVSNAPPGCVSAEDIRRVMDHINLSPIAKYAGLQFKESPFLQHKEPKLRLSDTVNVSPKLRIEFNQWLLKRFGTKGEDVFLMSKYLPNVVLAHPDAIVRLTEQI